MNKNEFPDTSNWPQLGVARYNAYQVSEQIIDMRRSEQATRSARLHALPEDLLIDLNKTALIIIDMQNDFCHPEGWIGGMGIDTAPACSLADPVNQVTSILREKDVPVIWLNWGTRPDKLNLSPGTQHPFNRNGMGPGLSGELKGEGRSYNVLQKGSWGAEIISDLLQDSSDIYVDKHRISGFWDTPLNSILRNMGVMTLLFAGVNADHCVLGTLMDANFHGYDTILLEDCTATTSPEYCLQATYHNVRFCFGFTTTSNDLMDSLDSI